MTEKTTTTAPYLRQNLVVSTIQRESDGTITLGLTPGQRGSEGPEPERAMRLGTPNSSLISLIVPKGWPPAERLERGQRFYLDLVPAEIGAAVGSDR